MGKAASRITKPTAVPPIRDGDRMNSEEFMRRYEAMPEGTRAELLGGVVHVNRWVENGTNGKACVMPPISSGGHGRPHFRLMHWLGDYAEATPGTCGEAPTTLHLTPESDAVEPDGVFYTEPEFGGHVAFGEDGYLHGAPELVIEISNTSAPHDLNLKRDIYEAAGVSEYLVWNVAVGRIVWFRRNRAGRFVEIRPDTEGVLRSAAFPGLWLDAAAMLARDFGRVGEALQRGLASPEHAKFAAKLAKKRPR